MGRWTQYDEDSYRLPEGVERIGYDSDTGRYYFRDNDGLLYKGPEGSEFGELVQVSELPVAVAPQVDDDHDDLEAAPTQRNGYRQLAIDEHGSRHTLRGGSYRTLFPFFLVVSVVLLLVWRLVLLPTRVAPAPCPSTTISYIVQSGDTCYDIARSHNTTLDKLLIVNPQIVCSKLMPGDRVCVPDEGSSISRRFGGRV
ncbi:carbohydrate-binding module family 50 protein [Pisolithus tinctorius]|uniref:Carbohydrate-binding module family 50 protein n=1 Tax=Pisolithus tinctorius Marx 270 TaxID=870435 RepID=A0A0C3KBS6_PISTI|nr:carbohydrate-binding module family 50 protein [Pisolithus tinctorius]KIO07092.1 carbohydrate-binding module family 50 protein [Pisolithus tinctorius Marx 270]